MTVVSTASDWIDGDELINDLETGSLVEDGLGYTQQLNDITSLLLFGIFALGVISGLIFSKIMWGRVKW